MCYRKLAQTLCHGLGRIIVIVEARYLFGRGENHTRRKENGHSDVPRASDIKKGRHVTVPVAIARRRVIDAADAENPARKAGFVQHVIKRQLRAL